MAEATRFNIKVNYMYTCALY